MPSSYHRNHTPYRPASVLLAGNPNTGKSTIFNRLTGMHQHTGNWAGTTPDPAAGICPAGRHEYLLIDTPGIYSLTPHTEAERLTCDLLRSDSADMIIVFCDAACPERGLRLLKQIVSLSRVREHATPLILCLNLCDEAVRRGISLDLALLRDVLQIPVVCCCAHRPSSLARLRAAIPDAFREHFSYDCLDFDPKKLAQETVRIPRQGASGTEMFDRAAAGSIVGPLVAAALLFFMFLLTLAGTTAVSPVLRDILSRLAARLSGRLLSAGISTPLLSLLLDGAFGLSTWLIAFLLPPTVIFATLSTFLEDWGYLPRLALCMDGACQRCRICTAQILAAVRGLSCRTDGILCCRAIASRRTRLIAVAACSFLPGGASLPLLCILMLRLCAGSVPAAALALTGACCFAFIAMFAASWLLSRLLLARPGIPCMLELPPFRRVCLRDILARAAADRTLLFLGRTAILAAPAGFFLQFMLNRLSANCEKALSVSALLLGLSPLTPDRTDGFPPAVIACLAVLCLFHPPGIHALWIIKKETASLKWTAVPLLLPALLGAMLCILLLFAFSLAGRLFGV